MTKEEAETKVLSYINDDPGDLYVENIIDWEDRFLFSVQHREYDHGGGIQVLSAGIAVSIYG